MEIKDTIYEEFYGDLYNPDLKIRFIEDRYPINIDVKRVILNNFKKSGIVEKRENKDLCVMNTQDISYILWAADYATSNTVRTALSFFSLYVDWCIENNLRGSGENGINDVAIFMKTQDFGKFVSKIKNSRRYLNYAEVIDIVDNRLVNYADKALLLCLYEGIRGQQMHEIRSLNIRNLDPAINRIIVIDKNGSQRIKEISEKLKELLIMADKEVLYTWINKKGIKVLQTYANSPYIFKPTMDSSEKQLILFETFRARLQRIKEYADINFITSKTVFDSGAINLVYTLTRQRGLNEPDNAVFRVLKQRSGYNLSDAQLFNFKKNYRVATTLNNF